MADYELYHSRKGYQKKNHKYISRFMKNGKWFYVYKNGKKYNKLQDWLGVDERDEFNDAIKTDYTHSNEATERYVKAIDAYFNTPFGKMYIAKERIIGIGQDFINSLRRNK